MEFQAAAVKTAKTGGRFDRFFIEDTWFCAYNNAWLKYSTFFRRL